MITNDGHSKLVNKYEPPVVESIVLDIGDMGTNNGCFTLEHICGHGDGGCGAKPPTFPDNFET